MGADSSLDSREERLLDGIVHAAGAGMSLTGIAILFAVIRAGHPNGAAMTVAATVVYSIGLLAMIWCSAAYNVIKHRRWKERLRRFDHAAIFLMIAGTYTPFALLSFDATTGHALLSFVWLAAIAGIVVKVRFPRRYERLGIVAYLALGWAVIPAFSELVASVSPLTLWLLLLGGVLYTTGVVFHLSNRLRFQNAIWHAFVLAAATCHFFAVLEVVSA
ncbi:MAG TPA: hemolysin III family protein [Alphaproteobacteria bacterium]|jgi:hemolysin III|nr:hemolysin III family protein [Alphaproteobacteria bacterium]